MYWYVRKTSLVRVLLPLPLFLALWKPIFLHLRNILLTKHASGIFLPLQKAAISAFYVPDSWITSINAAYLERRFIAWKILDLLECNYSKESTGLFVWAQIPQSYKSADHFSNQILNETKVFITPGFIFGSEGNLFIRISLCSSTTILNNALNNIKSKLKC